METWIINLHHLVEVRYVGGILYLTYGVGKFSRTVEIEEPHATQVLKMLERIIDGRDGGFTGLLDYSLN